MPRIDIRVHNLGMSGRPWAKTGTFDHPAQAARFLEHWWRELSCPTGWELEIDGMEYSVRHPFPDGEAHIHYCFSFHCAFYCDGEAMGEGFSRERSQEEDT